MPTDEGSNSSEPLGLKLFVRDTSHLRPTAVWTVVLNHFYCFSISELFLQWGNVYRQRKNNRIYSRKYESIISYSLHVALFAGHWRGINSKSSDTFWLRTSDMISNMEGCLRAKTGENECTWIKISFEILVYQRTRATIRNAGTSLSTLFKNRKNSKRLKSWLLVTNHNNIV